MNAVLNYRNLPVKRKLYLIIMGTVCTALMLTCAAVLIYVNVVLHQTMEKDLGILTEIFASNSTAALTFDDPRAAQELLAGLKARRSIEFAAVYSANGKVFASYSRDTQQPESTHPLLPSSTGSLGKNRLKVSKHILVGEQSIGTICFESDLGELHAQLKQSATAILTILFAAALVALVLASRLQRTISGPIR